MTVKSKTNFITFIYVLPSRVYKCCVSGFDFQLAVSSFIFSQCSGFQVIEGTFGWRTIRWGVASWPPRQLHGSGFQFAGRTTPALIYCGANHAARSLYSLPTLVPPRCKI